jgi:hypothetical protein
MCCAAVLCAETFVPITMQLCIRYLTEKEAVAAVGYAHRPYAIAAWRFLTKTGYINFGVAPGMSAKQGGNHDQPPKGTVIVVGAGMAGNIAVCAKKFDSSNSSILSTRVPMLSLPKAACACAAWLGTSGHSFLYPA